MDPKRAIWIKDPLAILADGAERGIVVQDGRIVELVRGAAGRRHLRRFSRRATMWCCRD